MKPARVIDPELHRRGFAPIIIVIGIVTASILGIFAIMLYKDFFVEYPKPNYHNLPEDTLKQGTPPAAPSDETANWKTYTNNTHKYSIKYPPGWNAEEAAHGGNFVEPIVIYPTPKEMVSDLEVQLLVRVDQNKSECVGDTSISFDGISGFRAKEERKFTTLAGQDAEGNVIPPKYVELYILNACVIKNNNTFVFALTDKNYSKENTFDQILSTFKFTD